MLVDTNVISEIWRPAGDRQVVARFAALGDEVQISALTFGELFFGIQELPDGRKKTALEESYHTIRTTYRDKVLPVSLEISETWGRMQARLRALGRPTPMIDGLIAATALHHDLTLMTRNTRDFEATGVRLFNPWED